MERAPKLQKLCDELKPPDVPEPKVKVSRVETPYAVLCQEHGRVFLTEQEYNYQMSRPDSFWHCPIDMCSASWDDDWYEEQKCIHCPVNGIKCWRCKPEGYANADPDEPQWLNR